MPDDHKLENIYRKALLSINNRAFMSLHLHVQRTRQANMTLVCGVQVVHLADTLLAFPSPNFSNSAI